MVKPSKAEALAKLRAYRSKLALAKSKGVVSKRIDARSHRPTKYMKARLKSLEGVLEGRQTAVKAPANVLREFREGGARIVNGRVITTADEFTRSSIKSGAPFGVDAQGVVSMRTPLSRGYSEEEIRTPKSLRTTGDKIKYIEDHRAQLEAAALPGDSYAFKLEGARSYATYADLDLLIMHLTEYETIEDIEEVPNDGEPTFFTIFRTLRDSWEVKSYNRPKPKRKRRGMFDDKGNEIPHGRPVAYVERKPKTRQEKRQIQINRMTLAQQSAYRFAEAERQRVYRRNKKGK